MLMNYCYGYHNCISGYNLSVFLKQELGALDSSFLAMTSLSWGIGYCLSRIQMLSLTGEIS